MATPIQIHLGEIRLPPTPQLAPSLREYQQAVSVWTRQAQATLLQFQKTLTTLNTSSIPEDTGHLYWSQALFDAAFAAKDTDDLTEGSTNLYFTTARARSSLSALAPLAYNSTTGAFSLPQSSGSQDGYLSSVDWTTFNSKVSPSRLINTTAPLAGGGDLSANRTLSIADAAADGTTKGAATFTASDFNSASGVISLDYANGQKASGSVPGFLSSTDWTTFNSKVSATRAINTTAPLAGGGDLSADRTLSIADAAADGVTKGAATFTASDFNSASGVIALDYANGQKASGSVPGFLSSTDWTTFNSKVSSTRAINTTAPLAGGGDLSSDRTLSIADAAADGATKGAATFTASDFNSASGVISLDYTNGQKASGSVPGFLSSTDWTTFNNKQNALSFGNLTAATSKISIGGTGTGAVIGAGASVDVVEANLTISNMGGTLGATHGGTGQTAVTTGDLLYGSAANTWSRLVGIATGNALISGGVGVAPSWGKIGLTTHVSGTLAVGNGGTGQTSFTAGYVLFGNGASAIGTDNNFTWNSSTHVLSLASSSPNSALVINATGDGGSATRGAVKWVSGADIYGLLSYADTEGTLALFGDSGGGDSSLMGEIMFCDRSRGGDRRINGIQSMIEGGVNTVKLYAEPNYFLIGRGDASCTVPGNLSVGVDWGFGGSSYQFTLQNNASYIMALFGGDDSTTPSNPVTPTGYIHILVDGNDSWFPYYQ